jgi:hypothetical protein
MHIDWHKKISKIDSKIVSKGIEIWLQVCLVWCYAEEKKKSLGIKSLVEGLSEIVERVFYVYFQLKSHSKSIAQINPSKSIDF